MIINVSKEIPHVSLIKDLSRNFRSEGQVKVFHFYLYGGGGGVDILLDSLALEAEAGTLLRSVGKAMLFVATVWRT